MHVSAVLVACDISGFTMALAHTVQKLCGLPVA